MTSDDRPISKLVIASHNEGKVVEIADLLAPFRIEVVSAGALGLSEPEETGDTYAANAALKARAAAEGSGLPALADDSGLSVAALDGAPGIHSARWAGEPRDFRAAMAKVERALEELGIEAAFLNSSLSAREQADVIRRLQAGEIQLLYVAPERIMRPGFLHTLDQVPVALIAIDEAHCVSQWGHDFRPEYVALGGLREHFPAAPFNLYAGGHAG